MPSLDLARRALTALTALRTVEDGAAARDLDEPTRAALAAWPGWGPLAKAFGQPADDDWAAIADQLTDLFTNNPADLAAAAEHVDTSFYTPPALIDALFALLRASGLTEGRILEPGCGSGRFMSATPADLHLQWTGIESDPTSARIAALLNPDAAIHAAPLQKVALATGSFDAAIGNVPFSNTSVYDRSYPSGPLHQYFLHRALDAVRPGGLVIAVTSRYTLDTPGVLSRLQEHADLITAVRLPTGAFASEGTSVITDVIVLRRRDESTPLTGWDDDAEHRGTETRGYYGRLEYGPRRTHTVTGPTTDRRITARVDVNRYWEQHPDHVAGTMHATGFDRSPLRVNADNPTQAALDILTTAHADVTGTYQPRPHTEPGDTFTDIALHDADGRPEGSFHLADDGTVHQVVDGRLAVVPRASAELAALIRLRDAAHELLTLETDPDLPDTAIAAARTTARDAYEAYVHRYGPLNRGVLHEGKPDPDPGQPALTWRRPPMGGFRRDPGYVTVLALEMFDQDTGQARPAPILLGRVNRRPTPATHAASPADALAVTLGEGRGIDLDRIAALLHLPDADAARAAIADQLYRDPTTGTDVLAVDYLAGDVRTKLAAARAAAGTDPSFERNVAALRGVLPADLGPTDIRATLGAPWIDAEHVTAFTRDVLGSAHRVEFTPTVAVWEVTSRRYSRVPPAAALEYGTTRMDPLTLLEHALNGKQPVVYDTVYEHGRERKVRNHAETLAAAEKLATLNERFSVWVWQDADRARQLCTEYNRRFNSHVARTYDGAHLTFPGLADGVQLWPWQRDGVARIIASERTLIGHAVGAGKTLTAICAAVTLRRFGLATKPLLAVPNHLLEQVAREAQQAYPTGKFLIASKDDLTGDGRRLFAARCATGDWDAVVMTHQGFGSLAVDPAVEAAWLQEQKATYRQVLSELDSYGNGRGAKAIASMLRTFDRRLAELRDTRTDHRQVLFDQLGIDFLAIDEAHYFKRLSTPMAGSSRTDGFSLGTSKRATDLLLKIDTLAARHPGRPVMAGFTGTPWTNTLSETFTWQTYLQPDRLAAAGITSFAAWAATFVKWETTVEVAPDGSGFRTARRPAAIQNVPELRGMLDDVADLLPADTLNLPRPDARTHNVAVEPGRKQLAAVAALADRAEQLRGTAGRQLPDGRTDNMLLVCTDGRRLALDPHLLDINEPSPKLAAAADQIARIYREHRDSTLTDGSPVTGVLQLAFCDQGTPRPGDTQTYGRLRTLLVDKGIPATAVRFVHEAHTDKARAALFTACRAGDVAVLLGSTEKLGIGTNVQRRLRAVHHIDAPWRPSDIEQRDGRALRPGNLNTEVDIYRYVTQRTFDAYMWQALQRKARFITQMFRREVTERDLDDIGDIVLSYGQVKALAAGNPHLLEQATLAATVKRFRVLHAVHQQSVNAAHQQAEQLTADADADDRRAQACTDALTTLAEHPSAPGDNEQAALCLLLDNIRTRRSSGVPWRGLTLTGPDEHPSWNRPKRVTPLPAQIVIDVSVGYRGVATLTLPRATLRRGDTTATAALTSLLTDLAAGLPAHIEQLHHQAAGKREQAAAAHAAADSAVFSQQDELDAALARLARVTAEIEAAASDTGGTPATAA